MEEVLALMQKIATEFRAQGGRLFLVGGTVRDYLLHRPITDIDVEVFGLDVPAVRDIAAKFGKIDEVGKAFSVLKLSLDGHMIDIALPRRESKSGRGHRGFTVTTDPHLSFADALRRRDFTMNAILLDPLTGEIIDPFEGQADLGKRILRMVNAQTFIEDPLRAMRAFQLTARFELAIDSATRISIQNLLPSMLELPSDRLRHEWEKLFLAGRPSLGLQLAYEVGFFARFVPDIHALRQTPQDPVFHPEGDVWTHTLQVVERARIIARAEQLDHDQTLILMLAAFLHDIGKSVTTATVDGHIRSLGHDTAGGPLADHFLSAQGFPQSVRDQVLPFVREHMHPVGLWLAAERGEVISPGAWRRLARRLAPASLQTLLFLTRADALDHDPASPTTVEQWIQKKAAEYLHALPAPLLRGQDFIALGWKPSPEFGSVLELGEQLGDMGYDRATLLTHLKKSGSLMSARQSFTRLVKESAPATTVAIDADGPATGK